jgi:hypothetical protein
MLQVFGRFASCCKLQINESCMPDRHAGTA